MSTAFKDSQKDDNARGRPGAELQKGKVLVYFKRLYLENDMEYGFNFWCVFILAIVEQLDKVSCKSELI